MDTPDDIDVNKLVGYALRLNSSAVIGRLGYLLEVLEIGDKRDFLRRQLGRAYVPLIPVAAGGKIPCQVAAPAEYYRQRDQFPLQT